MKRKTSSIGFLIAIASIFILVGGFTTQDMIEDVDAEGELAFAIGNNQYCDFKDAINNSNNGDTIVLMHDVVINATQSNDSSDPFSDPYATVSNKTLTLDLNGKTITYYSVEDKPSKYFLSTTGYAHLTVTDGSSSGTGKIYADALYIGLMGALEDSSIVIEKGTFVLDKSCNTVGVGMLTVQGNTVISEGSIEKGLWVKGGNFTLNNVGNYPNGSPWIFNAGGSNDGNQAIITGGKFNADIRNQNNVFEAEVPKEYALVYDDEEKMWKITKAVCFVNTSHKTDKWYSYSYGCESFEVALDKINETDTDKTKHGDTITMLDNCCISDLSITDYMEFTLDSVGKLYILNGQQLPSKISYVQGSEALCTDGQPHMFSHDSSCYPDGICTKCSNELDSTSDHIRPDPTKTCLVQYCKCGTKIDPITSHIPPEVCKDGPCEVCGTQVDTNDAHTLSNQTCVDRTCSVCNTIVPGDDNHIPNDVACKVTECSLCHTQLDKIDHDTPYNCKASNCSICGDTIAPTSDHNLPSTATCINRTCIDCDTVVEAFTPHDYFTTGHRKICDMCGDTINLPIEDDDDDDWWYLQWLAQQQAKAEAERLAKEMAEEEEQKKVAAVALATGVAVLMALLMMSVVKRN